MSINTMPTTIEEITEYLKNNHPDTYRDRSGKTILFIITAFRPNLDIVKLLLKHGADPNTSDEYLNPLMPCYFKYKPYSVAITKELLDNGSKLKNIMIEYAANQGNVDAVKLLLEYGASTEMGLEKACGDKDVLKLLGGETQPETVEFIRVLNMCRNFSFRLNDFYDNKQELEN